MNGWRIIVLFMSAVMLTGCITFKHPKGDWVYPVDLRLESGVLNGAVIGVRCGAGEPSESSGSGNSGWSESVLEGCIQTARAVRSLGATVVADEALFPAVAIRQAEKQQEKAEAAPPGGARSEQSTEQNLPESGYVDAKTSNLEPEMTVVYIDRSTEKDRCILRSLLFVWSFTLYPCPVDVVSRAELRVYDRRNIMTFQKDLTMDMQVIHGIPALYFLINRWISLKDYKAERDALADNMFQFLQNSVHAQHRRVRLAQASGGISD